MVDLLSPADGRGGGAGKEEIMATRPGCVPSEGMLGLMSPATGSGKEETIGGGPLNYRPSKPPSHAATPLCATATDEEGDPC